VKQITICLNESGKIKIAIIRVSTSTIAGLYATAAAPSSSEPVKRDSLSLRNCRERIINIVPKAVRVEAAAAVRIFGERSIVQLIKPKSETGRVLKPPNIPTLTAERLTTVAAAKSSRAAMTLSHQRGKKEHSFSSAG